MRLNLVVAIWRGSIGSPAARAFIEFCKRNQQLLLETARVAGRRRIAKFEPGVCEVVRTFPPAGEPN
jgi:hypothetical protein